MTAVQLAEAVAVVLHRFKRCAALGDRFPPVTEQAAARLALGRGSVDDLVLVEAATR